MSKNVITIFNRLLTASMLVASLMACQQMGESNINGNTLNFQGDRIFHSYR